MYWEQFVGIINAFTYIYDLI